MEHIHNISNQKKVLIIIIVTLVTMIAEIAYGYITNSMALLADGYHMGTHALALCLTYVAYVLTEKFKNSPLFPSGTGKIGTLTAYTSSLFLGFTGIWIIIEALERIFHPLSIQFNEAILIAIIGLTVNGICIFIMEGNHSHEIGHSHFLEHNHEHHHEHNCTGEAELSSACNRENSHGSEAETIQSCECEKHCNDNNNDYNYKAAYLHILADALTSILAIVALLVGKYFNLPFFDALIGILGGIMILKWAIGLLKHTVKELIDIRM